ncbi:unnamed protein product [Chironomus riparius]|uniref:EF-hand domain-containing protein n=1 Tax=Chironomus riparius TaxID=315576 RepID=A0A9P0JB05_9DIPT|nr:unnamed protein product [Chironomus riparius]
MFIKSSITLSILLLVVEINAKHGPHHPRNSYVVKRETRKQEFNEHLNSHDKEHLAEDLTGMHVKHKEISEMSDDEKSFYYFKIHDTDNNNNLDGLEMIKAALHRHGESNSQDELSHITSVVDEFLDFADLDKNGFLNYAEYVKAMNASNEDKYEEPPQSITSSESAESHQG